MADAPTLLRAALGGPGLVVAPFVYDAFQARLVETAGFPAAYMTGFGTAAARGYPDVGLLTLTEMVANVRFIANAIAVPLVCDADTGYGNAINVTRTVQEYERAGAAALHLEDQVWPKRCGFLEGKEVIPCESMVAKVRAACDARDDPDFVVIARTDALQPHGWDEAVRRAETYHAAGADLVFVDGIRTRSDLDTYAERLADLPRVYNGQLMPAREVEARGFRLMLHTGTLGVVYLALREALAELRTSGRILAAEGPEAFSEILRLLRVPEVLELGRRYEPD